MVKRWVDITEKIEEVTILDESLWEYQRLMEEIPNFDKSEGAKKVYEKKQYMILKVKRGYIVYNINKPFEKGHSHINGLEMAKVIIDNCLKKRRPKTSDLYLLTSHARVSDDEKYIKLINELIDAKKSKGKQTYRNRSK